MKIAICDDDKIFRQQIYKCLKNYNSKLELTEYSSGAALCSSDVDYDIIFLDIEMPDLNGMETAQKLRSAGRNGYIIFLTAHTEMIYQAFHVKAFRFLRKPLKMSELREAFSAAEAELAENQVLVIKTGGDVLRLRIREVMYLEAYGDGTYIYIVQGDVYDVHESLKAVAERLPCTDFFRIHKSYFIGLRYVRAVSNGNVIMDNQKELPLSRRNTVAFKTAYLEYVRMYGGGISK